MPLLALELLFAGAAIGWALWELRTLRRDRAAGRRDAEPDAERRPGRDR